VEEHPTSEDFARFLQQSPRPSHAERNALIIRHLLAGCGVCRRTLREAAGLPGLLQRMLEVPLDMEPGTPKSYSYDWVFAKTERSLAAFFGKTRPSEQVPVRLAELARLPEGEQIRRVGSERRFACPQLIHHLLDRSHAARYRSPRKTLHWAHLAQIAATACPVEAVGGPTFLADLQARAWGAFGNAQRICGNLLEAEEAMVVALQRCAAGTGCSRLRSLLLSQVSSLYCFQRRFDRALAAIEEAEALCRETSDTQLLATCLTSRAIILIYAGKAEDAIVPLNQAVPLIDGTEDPYLLLAAHHNLARCYIDLDRPEEALSLLCEARDLYRECGDPMISLNATWLEGQLLHEVGHSHNSEAALLRARRGFIEQGLAYEAALVCLDLAEVYSSLGDLESVRRVVSEALPIFRSMRIGREALASLLQLQRIGCLSEIL